MAIFLKFFKSQNSTNESSQGLWIFYGLSYVYSKYITTIGWKGCHQEGKVKLLRWKLQNIYKWRWDTINWFKIMIVISQLENLGNLHWLTCERDLGTV